MLGNTFDDSCELSAGQWQKIAMARGFVRDAGLLILDEPTSALDPHAEEILLQGFQEISRGRTTILISHRLSTAAAADRILVLEEGRIVEHGSHARLLCSQGLYAQMYELQARRYR